LRRHWIAAAGFVLAAPLCFTPISNPDLGWHLSAGRYIVEHGAIPRQDFLSWTKLGQPWMDFEWGTQLLYLGLFQIGGHTALWLFKAGVFLLLLVCFWALLRLWDLPPPWVGAAFLPLTMSLLPNMDLRAENLSSIFSNPTAFSAAVRFP